MSLTRLFLSLVLALSPLLRADTPPYVDTLPAGARQRLETLTRPATVVAAFKESRFTPLKKKPVVVEGIVRIDRARGLSLAYDQARAPIVILDEKGLVLRHPDGREQSPPAEAADDLRLLHALFVFDLSELEKAYTLSTEEGPDGVWTFTFTRRPESTATYRTLSLAVDSTRLLRIVLGKTPNLHTDIELEPPRLDVSFTAEELARYFR